MQAGIFRSENSVQYSGGIGFFRRFMNLALEIDFFF